MRRSTLLAVLIYGLAFAAFTLFEGRLLVLALPLIIALAAGLLYRPQKPCLRVERVLESDRVGEGVPVAVTLRVTNEGPALEEIAVQDAPPATLHVNGNTSMLMALASDETAEITYTVEGRRGCHVFESVQAEARDHFDLSARRETLPAPEPLALYVLPAAPHVRRVAIRPRQTRVYAGSIPTRVGGAGIEFFGVRLYQPSDPPRHINWKVSARHTEALFTNEFEQEHVADVGLIVDARQRVNAMLANRELFEYSVLAASALAQAFLQEGNRVGLLLYGRFLDWTTPGYGKYQRERILRALARAESGESQVFDGLQYLPTRYFPAKSQLVLISPLCADDPPFLIALRSQGYELLVISPNPVAFERKALPDTPEIGLAARIAAIERTITFRRLRQAGVRVVDWNVEHAFERTLATALAHQPPRVRPLGIVR